MSDLYPQSISNIVSNRALDVLLQIDDSEILDLSSALEHGARAMYPERYEQLSWLFWRAFVDNDMELNDMELIVAAARYTNGNGHGGTVAGWNTCPLNTLETSHDNLSWCTLASNQLTLAAGVYFIHSSQYTRPAGWKSYRLYNVTDTDYIITGNNDQSNSFAMQTLAGIVTLSSASVLRLEVKFQLPSNSGFGDSNTGEDYTTNTTAIMRLVQ